MSDITDLDARFGDMAVARPAAPRAPAGQATQVEQARAIAEVRAAVMIAMDRPRDRTGAIAEMREVCGITLLAERAFFRVPRGGEHVNGESIHLARELARCWGNIDYGVKELARDDVKGQSELLAFAWDLQTNARSEITFIVPHTRGRKRLAGTQEIYENNASFAGRRLREAIFAVLPVWFKAEAAEICHKTLETGGGKPLVQRIADLRAAFEALGVAVERLERKRGRKIDEFLPEDVGALRVVYGSLKRGEVTIADEFPKDEPEQRPAGGKLEALEQIAAAEVGAPPPQEDPRLRRLRQLRRTAGIPGMEEAPDAMLLEAGFSQEEINEEKRTRGWPQADSPAGGHPADGARDEPADQPPSAPVGEHAIPDLLGGEPRPPASRAYQLPSRPTPKDMQAFADWIDGELADGVSGRVLRANNDTTLRHMKVNVPDLYDAVQSKLGML